MLSERDRPPHIPHEQLPATVGTLSVALVRSNESLRAAHTLLARLQSEAEAVDAERTALKSEAAKLRSALVERQRELGAAHARSSAAVEAVAAAEGRATRAGAAAVAARRQWHGGTGCPRVCSLARDHPEPRSPLVCVYVR